MKEFFEMLAGAWWGILILTVSAVFIWFLLSALLYRVFFKRFYDILLSGLALLILSPLFILIAVLVRAKLGKPVIFTQARPGKKNKIFRMRKFRTMTDGRDAEGNLLPDQERLTRFGKFLRAASLDELPGIWDIFRGKMSIIGPRPQLIKDLVFMDDDIKRRHRVRPGLTGLAQVSGRNNISWDKRFAFDLAYVKKINIFSDIKIFFKTIFKVFKRADVATDGMATSEDYGDFLLRTDRITQEEYNEKLAQMQELINHKKNTQADIVAILEKPEYNLFDTAMQENEIIQSEAQYDE